MGKGYGEQDKDSLREENVSLRKQIEYYEDEDTKARNRSLALSYAAGLAPQNLEKKAEDVIADAKVIEAYLNGDTQEDPDVVVPSPS